MENIMSQPEFVTPNFWILSGDGVHIRYSTEAPIFGGTHLTYDDGQRSLTFSGSEIRSVEVEDLGTLISVTIIPSVDADSTTLTLLLPRVNILLQGPISSAPVVTDGIRTVHVGPFGPPFGHGQREFYTVFPLSGTASHVLLE
jgi:hypothetical protein